MKVVFAILGILAAVAIAVSLGWFYLLASFRGGEIVADQRSLPPFSRVLVEGFADVLANRVRFSAFGTVEEHPDEEIVAELFEAVDHARLGEEHVVQRNRMAMRTVDEPAATARDDVDLVARMRLLRIGAARCV